MSSAQFIQRLRERGLRPHQVDFIDACIELGRGRVVLADPVGSGKTYSVAGLLWALSLEATRPPRALIVCPAQLVPSWSATIQTFGLDPVEVDAAQLRRMEAETSASQNPWSIATVAIVSIDLLKRPDRTQQVASAHWDVVAIDEAHLSSTSSKRGHALRALWAAPTVDLLIAVGAVGVSDRQIAQLALTPPTSTFARSLDQLRDWDGTPLSGSSRRARIINVVLSVAERAVISRAREMGRARQAPAQESAGLKILAARAGSSLYALEQSLRRSLVPERELFDAKIPVEADDIILDDEEQPEKRGMRPEFEALIALLERVERDSKLEAFTRLMDEVARGSERRILVFTEFRDTAEYLFDQLTTADPDRIVGLLVGSMTGAERATAAASLAEAGGALIATTAAAQGMSMGFADTCVHYDLPTSDDVFELRIGRVDRFGSRETLHYVVVDEDQASESDVGALFNVEA